MACKVDLLPAQPPRCYRCLERGHTVVNCASAPRTVPIYVIGAGNRGMLPNNVAWAPPIVRCARILVGVPTTSWGARTVPPKITGGWRGRPINIFPRQKGLPLRVALHGGKKPPQILPGIPGRSYSPRGRRLGGPPARGGPPTSSGHREGG